MTDDEIKAARALCEETFCFARSEEAVFLDTMADALDALEAARRERDEARAEVERLRELGIRAEQHKLARRAGAMIIAQRAEVDRCRDLIGGLVRNACSAGEGFLSSMESDANCDAIRYLAETGEVEIISEAGRMIVARWKP